MRRLLLAVLISFCIVSTSFAYRSVYSETVRDSAGNIMTGATVRVYLQNTGVAANIYENLAATSPVSSVITSSDGSFLLYVDHFDYDSDQTFKIVVTRGTSTKTYEDVTMNRAVMGTYAGNKTVTTVLNVPKGVFYSGNITVTTGSLQAGPYQIFTGTGTVTGLSESVPEWWGAVADGVTDSTYAFNQAINMGGPVYLSSGTYLANAVHTSGFPIIQGAGMGVTYIKSYSASGYAWTESGTTSSWNSQLVMNDLSILGTGTKNGLLYNNDGAGSATFNRVSFQGNVKGFDVTAGGYGLTFNKCYFVGNSYGYYAASTFSNQTIFNQCSIRLNTLAGFYLDASTGSGGQYIFNGGGIDENAGFGIFVKSYPIAYGPLTVNGTWFEQNSTSGSVTINGTAYTPRDVYIEDTAYAVMDGVNLVNTSVQLVDNSSMLQNNCSYNLSYDVVDATSILRQTNVNSSGTNFVHAPTDGLVESVSALSGSFGASYGGSWKIPQRQSIVGGYTRMAGAQYNGTAGVTTYAFSGTTPTDATCVADGVLYDTCAELTITAGNTLANTAANSKFTFTSGRWYVWSMDAKLTTTYKPTVLRFENGTGIFNRDFAPLLVKDKWVTFGGVSLADDTVADIYAPYIIGHATESVTLRMSAVQVVEFLTKAEAINYFNSRLYRKE
jgi:hypothetical protein